MRFRSWIISTSSVFFLWGRLALGAPPASPTQDHWAFEPIQRPAIPAVSRPTWIRTPVDAFVLATLDREGFTHAPEADRRTLLRRLSYTLTGLPPSEEDVREFVNDPSDEAYERQVDRYLASPAYAEHWARHWLDVARYSDTKGYVYAREERFWVHAWTYRDWVVRAFNEDLPYDRFLLLQIAADQIDDRRPDDLAAMGFLTVGRRFLGVKRDIIDDRIDVVSRGMMGLTVGCARCHDHKFDPIPTADYYSLYGVFDSCLERMEPLATGEPPDEEFQRELAARREKFKSTYDQRRVETADRVRARVGEYFEAQFHLQDFPEEGFDQIIEASDLIPSFVRRWKVYLEEAKKRDDPIFVPWHAYASLPSVTFADESPGVTTQLRDGFLGRVHPLVLGAFETPPTSMAEVAARYGHLLQEVDRQWRDELERATASGVSPPDELPDPNAESLRRLLYGPGAPCEVPDEPIVHTEYDFTTSNVDELWGLQGDVDRWLIQSPVETPYALTLVDRERPIEPRIFRRGNPANKGAEVPRQFLSLLSGPDREPFQHGSGRLELARAIVDPANPLTARVIVNRVWAHHFGEGLVTTPSDFGTRAGPPSHPELLDWLATRLMDDGWSIKRLHRLIVLSSTFRQSSTPPLDDPGLAEASRRDPSNRLLWRMNVHRLTFEEFRDALFAASGDLDLRVGGKPTDLLQAPYAGRRTLYGLVDRQFLPSTLRIFDFANPDLHIAQRSETTVPQQALFILNHPLLISRVRDLAAAVDRSSGDATAVRELFRRCYQRPPTEEQLSASLELLKPFGDDPNENTPSRVFDWAYGYGKFDEAEQRTISFAPLPHFNGEAWQGGPKWPDEKLGWAQLTATGGHPGNDREHAAIRRWTAPRDMAVTIRARVTHEPAEGDGIRFLVASSRRGLLHLAKIQRRSSTWELDSLQVEAGETIDFIVDLGDDLNSDQFLCEIALGEAGAGTAWSSAEDFSGTLEPPLTAWEQLAQVLLSSNEFLFVD